MEKEIGQVKFTEVDGKFRIEVSGDRLKEMFSKCCVEKADGERESECCSDSDGHCCICLKICCGGAKEASDCCSDDDKKKEQN